MSIVVTVCHLSSTCHQVYLQHRLQTSSVLLRSWLQLGLVIMAAVSSLSRITDNRHHATDVWVGAIIGVAVAVIATQSLDQVSVKENGGPDSKQSQIGLLGAALR